MWPFDRKKRKEQPRASAADQSANPDLVTFAMTAAIIHAPVDSAPPDSHCNSVDSGSSCDAGSSGAD